MSSNLDDLVSGYLLLLQRAELIRGEDLAGLGPAALLARLAAAGREAALPAVLPDEDFLARLIGIVEPRGNQEITIEDLWEAAGRSHEQAALPAGPVDSWVSSEPSYRDGWETRKWNDPFSNGTFAVEEGLPGEEDFPTWTRKDDEDL